MPFVWFRTRAEYEAFVSAHDAERRVIEQAVDERETLSGYCAACRKVVDFKVTNAQRKSGWINLAEGLLCPCGMNARMRVMYEAILLAARHRENPSILLFERLSTLYATVAKEFPKRVIGTEYLRDDYRSGEIINYGGIAVRHEDMLATSFPTGAFDLVAHTHVLEHISDYGKALAECCRIVAPGGSLVFSCPWYNIEKNIIRARIVNGQISHDLPAVYHDNPLPPNVSLVFTEPGWPLWDDIRAAGFKDVMLGVNYDPFRGYLTNANPYPEGHMWQIVFWASK